jgi:hypothetical protein
MDPIDRRGVSVLDPKALDATVRYRIDGLPGQWRCLWADGSEAVFHRGPVKALVAVDSLVEVGPGHLHLTA